MTRYKNQRELDEMVEDQLEQNDAEVVKEEPKEKEVDWKTRYSDLRRYQTEKENSYKSQLQTMQRELEGIRNGTLKPPKSREEINEWKENYPEFSEVLESWIAQAVEDKTKDFKRQSLEIKREKALIELTKLVPDAVTHLQPNSEFLSWLNDQSTQEYNTIHNSFDYKSAAFIMNKFKAETGKGKKSEMDDDFDPKVAARSVRTRTQTTPNADSDGYLYSESQIEEMSRKDPRWWDANEEKILDAQRRGKVLMDLMGGAR